MPLFFYLLSPWKHEKYDQIRLLTSINQDDLKRNNVWCTPFITDVKTFCFHLPFSKDGQRSGSATDYSFPGAVRNLAKSHKYGIRPRWWWGMIYLATPLRGNSSSISVPPQREKLIHELEEERRLRLESEKRLREVTEESELGRAQVVSLQQQFSR